MVGVFFASLCVNRQLLERLEAELCALPRSCAPRLALPRREVVPPCDIIRSTFQGELLSEVGGC